MQVYDFADDLKVSPEALIALLRQMGIPVADEDATITDAQVSKVLAKVEKERRAGHKDPAKAIAAALEEASPSAGKRRRRKKEDLPEPEAPVEEPVAEVEPEVSAPEVTTPVVAPPKAAPVVAEMPQPEVAPRAAPAPTPEETREVAPRPSAPAPPPEPAAPAAEERFRPAPPSARSGAPEGPVRTIRRPTPAPAASAGPGGQVRIQAEGYTADGRKKRREKKKGKRRQDVDQDEVQSNIQRVMSELKGSGKKKRRKGEKLTAEEQEALDEQERQDVERERTTVRVNEFLTVAELAELIGVPSNEIIGSAFKNLHLLVTINQRLDFDQIEMLLDAFGFTAVREEEYGAEPEVAVEEDAPDTLRPRPPVVTVMGHVDHGKTLLLDRIRNTNVVAGEAGGITQHIGAYHVELPDDRSITFLDTPGHAAFTAMRARGAEVTDIVILLVAADDSVMPQTVEAISHAKNAGVPIVVAINKTDLPAAQPLKVKQQLMHHNVQVEDFGGTVLSAEVSAKTGKGIDDLLDKVLLQAEMLELKANPDREAQGAVIEAQLDIGKGPVVTVLVQRGTLKVGDSFLCGLYDGRVRALLDERGHSLREAGPATPVQVLGASGVPQAGDTFQVMDQRAASEIALNRQRLDREKQMRIRERGVKLGDFGALVAAGQITHLPLVIKGDVDGSVQALSDALEQLGTDEVQVDIVHRGVGAINESDVLLAQTAGAVIIGFRVRPQTAARHEAEKAGVDIRVYDVIYEAVDEVTAALEGMLAPERKETVVGTAEVRATFKVSKVGTIAGSFVTEGRIDRKARARVIRDGVVVYDGDISSLKRFKDDVKEVRESFECGIGIANFNDIKVGDLIECYTVEEVARTLAGAT
jgi:translation initiation factor IF-2